MSKLLYKSSPTSTRTKTRVMVESGMNDSAPALVEVSAMLSNGGADGDSGVVAMGAAVPVAVVGLGATGEAVGGAIVAVTGLLVGLKVVEATVIGAMVGLDVSGEPAEGAIALETGLVVVGIEVIEEAVTGAVVGLGVTGAFVGATRIGDGAHTGESRTGSGSKLHRKGQPPSTNRHCSHRSELFSQPEQGHSFKMAEQSTAEKSVQPVAVKESSLSIMHCSQASASPHCNSKHS